MKKKSLGTLIFYVLIILGAFLYIGSITGNNIFSNGNVEKITYNELVTYIQNDQVASIEISMGKNETAYVQAKLTQQNAGTDQYVTAYAPIAEFNTMIDAYLSDHPGTIDVTYGMLSEDTWSTILMIVMMIAVIGFVFFIFMSQQGGGGGKVMNFGKSKARLYMRSDKDVTFKNVAGADEEKEELAEIVDFLKYPDRYMKLGARIPKGVLLVGPPGTGKTLLARATAGEAGVPFFTISGSDFVEMFVGVGASRVRDLFESAKKNAPCIVFIDEIDAVGRHRGAGLGGGNDEREQTLNQLLVEMDGFTDHQGIIVIAATNRADILDPALMRPGRFDRQIKVGLPDVKGREEILEVHSKNKPLDPEVKLKTIAQGTAGFTGADLENIMNESSLLAAREKKKSITMTEIEEAIKRVAIGPAKKSKLVSDEDKRSTAYHETGHAVVAQVLPSTDPVHEISIIPRGHAGGYTLQLPEKDNEYTLKNKLLNDITIYFGGRAAEELFLDDISTGAYSDIKQASRLARLMITELGMSEELGPINFGSGEEDVFIGRDLLRSKNFSEEVSSTIDREVKKIIDQCHQKARDILTENKEKVDLIVKYLLEKETLSGDEFRRIFDSGSIEIA
ncbi:MAG: ATP-dependent zinc metalloprotease FtsH [Anaerofustis sp.]